MLDPKVILQTAGLIGLSAIVFAESGLFFGFFLPGDSLLFTAGFLASQGYFSLPVVLMLCFIFAVLGDSFGYAFGRKMGPKIFNKEDSFFWSKKRIEQTKNFYNKYGVKTIILARFVPVVRTFAPILAGVGRMDYKTFVFNNILGGALWVFVNTLLGYTLGSLVPNAEKYLLPSVLIIIFISFLPPIFHIIKEKRSKNNV